MTDIIPPIERALLRSELNRDTFLRYTNKGGNELYIVNSENAPNTLLEIGRLRELAFRASGGGTGKALDLDEYDSGSAAYNQLIVWDPEEKQIVAGYRYIQCQKAFYLSHNRFHLATEHLFRFSDRFKSEFLPHTIELGRSFVQPSYQADSRKGLFSLDNLWDGLGALTVLHPEVRYLFGKVTMYTTFEPRARDGILWFLGHYFPDSDELCRPHKPLDLYEFPSDLASEISDLPYREGHRVLNRFVRERGENIPPLVNSYMNLSATMRSFGTAMNHSFGEVEETGIMVTIGDVYPEKKSRHVETFERDRIYGQKPVEP